MQQIRLQVRRLGPHFRIVLLRGEVGTGKELVARALHSLSSHSDGSFVPLGCSRDQYVAGDIQSWLTKAHRGTLYLDHIDGLGMNQQAELLAALRKRERAPIGPILVRGLEARIIASTGEDLRVAVATNRFLQELHRRIAAVEILIPPLRERLEDIPALVRHFAQRYSADVPLETLLSSPIFSDESRWNRNVEELEDKVRRTIDPGAEVDSEEHPQSPTSEPIIEQASPAKLQDVVEQHVLQVLKECGGNKVRAAEVLGISRSTLYRMLESGLQAEKVLRLR